MQKPLHVALLANLKANTSTRPGAPADALAEYDAPETVQAITEALTTQGHRVTCLEANQTLVDTLRQAQPDICFNIAEGLHGDARESHVPAILEMLQIPYTGSQVLTHALSLDKAMTKSIWQAAGLATSPFQVFRTGREPLAGSLAYPLFVKPIREGSGMGIDIHSLVEHEPALRQQVDWVIRTYRQPALVEGYLPGREFTVGLIGNTGKRWGPSRVSYNNAGFHLFPVLEIDATVGAGQGVYNTLAKSYLPGEAEAPLYLCPATIPEKLEHTLKRLATAAFEAINGLDVGRVDFRMGPDQQPYLMEINTLPGLNPIVSDLCIMAQAEGIPYPDLIAEILDLARERYGI